MWDWMSELRANGVDSLAIPHNSNISGGAAFDLADYEGAPIDDDYAKKRAENEPLVEITQVKGTSETHPLRRPTMNGLILKLGLIILARKMRAICQAVT